MGLVVATIIATIAAVLGKDLMSRRELREAQARDEQQRDRELGHVDDTATARRETVAAQHELAVNRAAQEHRDRVDVINAEAATTTPTDLDELAMELLDHIRR